jgi:hypothetical protein
VARLHAAHQPRRSANKGRDDNLPNPLSSFGDRYHRCEGKQPGDGPCVGQRRGGAGIHRRLSDRKTHHLQLHGKDGSHLRQLFLRVWPGQISASPVEFTSLWRNHDFGCDAARFTACLGLRQDQNAGQDAHSGRATRHIRYTVVSRRRRMDPVGRSQCRLDQSCLDVSERGREWPVQCVFFRWAGLR